VLVNAAWISGRGSVGTTVPTTNDNSTVVTINGESQNVPVRTDGSYNPVTLNFTTRVTDGTISFAIHNNDAAAFWFVWDITDIFHNPSISEDATELPSDGTMAADTWYYVDITTAADNYNATATSLNDVVYTTDGTILVKNASSVTTNFSATNNSLSATRYYVKSSSANNLVLAPAAYAYEINAGSPDATFIQPGQTVTVSYNVSTNDPNATLSQEYSGVTFNGNVPSNLNYAGNGFSFTVPDNLTANTENTLSIPAGAIKYNDDNQNAEQTITLKTPALFDGTYFLKVAATYDGSNEGTSNAVGKYLARGCAYSTHVSLDSYGLPVVVTTDGNNVTNLKMADTNAYIFSPTNSSWDIYADGSATEETNYTISILNSKYLIASNYRSTSETTKYFKYNTAKADNEEIAVFDDGTGTNNGPIIMWAVETVSEHATAMQAKKNSQAATAAAAACASGNYETLSGITTVADLESELTTNYIEGAFVSASEITSVSESYQPRNNTAGNEDPVTVYSSTINITEPGFYKFSMQAFNRATWNENVQALHNIGADMPAAVLFFGDSETQIKSLYDETGHDTAVEGANPADALYNGTYYANCMTTALKMFKDDKYHNDVWFYCSTPGTYTYGVKVMGYAAGQWFIYSPQSVSVTSYSPAATDEEYTAMSTAMTNANANLGFEAGDIAPYVLAPLAAQASDILTDHNTNGTKYSKVIVNSLTSQMNSRNADVVNAFYDGGFENTAVGQVRSGVTGWTTTGTSSGDQSVFREILSAAKFTSGHGFYVWPSTFKYGETSGYTMPLKANSIYKFTYSYAGQSNTVGGTPKISILNSSNEGVALTETGTGAPKYTEGVKTYTIYFVTGSTDGDYIFTYEAPSGTNTVFGDLSLMRVESLDFADGSMPNYVPGTYPTVTITRTLTADHWATAVYPFAVSGVDNIAVLGSYDASTGALGFTTAEASTANVPFLMKSATDKTEITMSNVAVAAAAATDATAGKASLKGTYTETDITNSEKNYVLSGNKIYPVGTAGATIPAYRAYIQIDQAADARALTFFVDGEATAIEGIEAESLLSGKVYNLNGQQVEKPRKGLYIQNGKKVVVK